MIKGSAQNCTEKGCMGKPKKKSKFSLEGMDGVKCDFCFRVVEYEKTVVDNGKQLTIKEDELEKLIKEADKKKTDKRKTEKKNENKQGFLF